MLYRLANEISREKKAENFNTGIIIIPGDVPSRLKVLMLSQTAF